MSDILATAAVVLGTALCLLGAVGIVRMPDVYIRLQVASKASSLGVALLMLGVAVHFGELSVTVRSLLVVVFLFLTTPVAAHVIGRAAYLTGVPLAEGSEPDDLAGRYDPETGRLAGVEPGPRVDDPTESTTVDRTGTAAADRTDPDADRPSEGEAAGHP